MSLAGTVLNAAADAAAEALALARSGAIRDMEGAEEYVGNRLGSILDVLMPGAKAEVATLLEPATKQAVEAIKPAMYEALRDWTPSFATMMGGMIGLSVLLGVWVAKRVFSGTRRNPRGRFA